MLAYDGGSGFPGKDKAMRPGALAGAIEIRYEHKDACGGRVRIVLEEGPAGLSAEIRVSCDQCDEARLAGINFRLQDAAWPPRRDLRD